MSARHLRNMRVRLDPNDHGYAAPRADVGELEVDRSCDQIGPEVDYDQRERRARRRS
ncbi:MAG TPA: hypothetical protein VIV58_22580 [Kofleriaceae bacterium]